jgi:molybdate transport repressor ModE-like protein
MARIFMPGEVNRRSQSAALILRLWRRMRSMPTTRRALDYRVDPFDLQLFAAVTEHGSITAAAQAMSLSLAAASTRLKALEHRVGARLLERSKAGAAPSSAGRALARHAHRVLAELDALHVEMAAFGRGLRGTVRLLCNTAAMAELLPHRLGRFLIEHPDIDVDLVEHSSDGVLEALRRGAADVGIVADHVDTEGLQARPWVADELVALLPPQAKALQARTIAFARLLDRPFVGLTATSGLSRFLLQQAARSGRVPHHRVRVGTLDAVAQLVEAGVGVAVMPRRAAMRRRAAKARIVPLHDAWARRTLLVCSTDQAAALPGVQALIKALLTPHPRPA